MVHKLIRAFANLSCHGLNIDKHSPAGNEEFIYGGVGREPVRGTAGHLGVYLSSVGKTSGIFEALEL